MIHHYNLQLTIYIFYFKCVFKKHNYGLFLNCLDVPIIHRSMFCGNDIQGLNDRPQSANTSTHQQAKSMPQHIANLAPRPPRVERPEAYTTKKMFEVQQEKNCC